MKRILGYLKPFTAMVVATVCLLFVQNILDLRLPDLMSNIVNVGIQRGGITETVPAAISPAALSELLPFMSEEQAAAVESAYRLVTPESATAEELAYYTALETGNVYLLNRELNEDDTLAAVLEPAFAQSFYARALAYSSGTAGPPESYREAAAAAPATALSLAAANGIKTVYAALGVNTNWLQTSYILKVGGQMLLACALSVLASVGIGYFASRTGAGLARAMRKDMFSHVEHFSSEEIDKFGAASLITRTTNDISQIQMMITMGLRMVISAPIMGVGGVVMALKKSPSMAWLIAVAVLCITGLVVVLFAITVPRFTKIQKLTDKLNLVLRENLSGMLVIRAFGSEEFEAGRFAKANADLTKTQVFVGRVAGLMQPGMMIIMNGLTLIIVWVGAQLIAASSLQVGDMMAFLQYAMQIIQSFFMLSMVSMMLPQALVSVRRVNEVMETVPSITDPETPVEAPAVLRSGIAFNNVSFQYPGAEENALTGISFTAKPGEKVAFIGATGAGKTALVNLIPRFYDVNEGSITLEGVDIRQYRQKDLRSRIGYVPQKGVLFSGTIASNLTFGKSDATEEEMASAAATAQAKKFIEALPAAYETEVAQGGTSVSGGQRQRLSIARALMTNAPIYIFDDSFSALDFKTDAALRKALNEAAAGAIQFIVAQRINTIMGADKIIVLENGRIVGNGTHKELMESCAAYQEIALSQLSKEELA